MGQPNTIVNYNESQTELTVTFKKPSSRYIDEFLSCKCAEDLLFHKLFPNAKEITESFAAYNAVRKALGAEAFGNANHSLIAVGDGSTPRTASMFAYRTRWSCFSVDPNLKYKGSWQSIERVTVIPFRIEQAKLTDFIMDTEAVIVAVHSHADLQVAVNRVLDCGAMVKLVVAIPCCCPQELELPPTDEYADWGIWSPHRTVKVWKFAS